MEKIIKIDKDTSLKLSNNIGWFLHYRNQFGHDIVPTLIPLLNGALDIFVEMAKAANGGNLTVTEILETLDTDVIRDALLEASGLEFVDFIRIIWAMAKAADEDIDEPSEWVKQFEAFPLDVILPAAFDMVLKCLVSSKNLKGLQTKMNALKPSHSNPSS